MNLSAPFEQRLERLLKARGQSLHEAHKLAAQVKRLSDFYVNSPGEATPWNQEFTQLAYPVYFLPLNVVRLRTVFQEVKRFLKSEQIQSIWDYGSGLGTTQWVLEDESWLAPAPLYCVETGSSATSGHRELLEAMPSRWTPSWKAQTPGAHSLAVFSYSFLEMQNTLPDLSKFDHVLILEPSTRECGRQLMAWREKLIQKGFHALAPCTHNLPCPLLHKTPRDWCHLRVAFEAPDWWLKIEDHLPMKNRTLTFSYLLMSKSTQHSEWAGATRVLGDTLKEKGKTRQLICRRDEREFLSWLHRHGEPPRIPSGALIKNLAGETKGQEIRINEPLEWTL